MGQLHSSGCNVRRRGVQPDHAVHMAEPGHLALGVVAGGLLELFGAGIQRGRPLKIGEELLVADGLRCRAVGLAVVIDQ